MISIKRNKVTGKKVVAKGKRVKANSIYKPNQENDYQISRSKFQDFLACPRTFWFDQVQGLKRPSMPQWTLNTRTDTLLKKEFDECRKQQVPHDLMKKHGLDYLLPYKHENMTTADVTQNWREPLHGGLKVRYKDTNIILGGGIDDMWMNTRDNSCCIVEYKSQSNNHSPTVENYLSGSYKETYKVQMDYYAYLMKETGMNVSDTGYFVVVNAIDKNSFDGFIEFEQIIVPYQVNTDWISEKIDGMIEVLNSQQMPLASPYCENAAYEDELVSIRTADIKSEYLDKNMEERYSHQQNRSQYQKEIDFYINENEQLKARLNRLGPKSADKKPKIKFAKTTEEIEAMVEDLMGGENVE